MGIILAFIAGAFMPLTNLFVRKSVDVGGSTKAFFVFQMLASLLLSIVIGPLLTRDFSPPLSVVLLGSFTGLVLSVMLYSLGRAIEKGPPGLTFAILNSATVMPGLIMALLFGAALGYDYTLWHGLGSLLVIAGLFWAGKGLQGMKEMRSWVFFSIAMFVFHFLLLALYQWRALQMNVHQPEFKSEWFSPFMFLSCGVVQGIIYLRSRQTPKRKEILFGTCGGISNAFCTFFLLIAAKVANPLENAVIFPLFSVVGIILTNLWGQKLYQEQVNWRACQLCLFGLFIGTVDWKAVSAAIGF